MALMSMALVSGTERDAIFLEKLNEEHRSEDKFRARGKKTNIPKFTE